MYGDNGNVIITFGEDDRNFKDELIYLQIKRDHTTSLVLIFSNLLLTREEIMILFQTVGNLPKLQKLKLIFSSNDNDGPTNVPFSVLADAITNAEILLKLYFSFGTLHNANEDELGKLSKALACHQSLREFKLSFDRSPNNNNVVNSILQAVSVIPTMEKIFVFVNPYPLGYSSNHGISATTLGRLFGKGTSKNLKSLKLGGLKFGEDHIESLTGALRENNSLKELRLWKCDIQSRCAIQLANMLRYNNALEKLDLSYNYIGASGCIELAKALECNTTLQSLYLHQDKGAADFSAESESDDEGDSRSGNKETFRKPQICVAAAALQHMLEMNFSIKNLWTSMVTPNRNENVFNIIHFYLNLNSNGKRNILRKDNATEDEWLDTLMIHQNQLPELYYFISKHPMLVNNSIC